MPTDDAYNSVIWSVADVAMTIVATSMPILRVFVTKAVNSAIETYHNSSSRSKSRSEPSRATSKGADVSLRQSCKRVTDTVETRSRDLLENRLAPDSKGYLELEDRVVDERTGRVTVATPESITDVTEHQVPEWLLQR